MLRKSRQVYRQLGHDGKSLHANLSNRNQVRTSCANTDWGITIIKKRKMNVYNCKYNCCYTTASTSAATTATCDYDCY